MSLSDATKKKIRPAVKSLELKPSEYTVIYQGFVKAVSEGDLKSRLISGLGKEQGVRTYENVLPIYQALLTKLSQI